MTEKQFRVQEHCIRSSYGIEAENWLVTNDNHSVVLNNKAEAHMVANMFNDVIDVLNELNDENQELQGKYDAQRQLYCQLNSDKNNIWQDYQDLKKENKQLKSELSRYKEVNRLDIWKSSYSSEDALITELQNKCDKKQEHIVVLENKIHRMREAIHKLEWLATYRNGELIRENKQLKIDLGIAEDNRKLDKEIIDDIHNEFQKVKEENEQLKQLLREVEHELTSLTGLSCFDKCASQLGYVEVFDNDRIDLDYSDLLKKIEKVMLND